MNKLDHKINFKAFFIDLDEIPDKMDIDIKLLVKKAPEVMKTVSNPKNKNTIALF